jgi:hypothetical protein
MTERLRLCEEPTRSRKVEEEITSAIQSPGCADEPRHHLRRFVQRDDELDFSGYLTGQRIHPHRRSSVPTNGIADTDTRRSEAAI